jgi:hypothetical protein
MAGVADRLKVLATERPRFGWRRVLVMFRREAAIGEFRFRRFYRNLGLHVGPRKKQKVRYVRGNAIDPATAANERWSVDVHDRLGAGCSIRAMSVVDDFTRECLILDLRYSFSTAEVIRGFRDVCELRGRPKTIGFDNGAKFTSRAMLEWGADPQRQPCTSLVPASRSRTRTLSPSTAEFATSFSMPTSSSTYPKHGHSPTHGGSITTKPARTRLWAIGPQGSSPKASNLRSAHS